MALFDVHEQSILDLQAAQTSGRVTSRGLVDAYLARIQAYDRAGPRLNAIVTINPRAREEADALDRERADKKLRGPLHGIPVLIKDNYDTADMPTSGGSLALATLQPAADAFQVSKLRDAGAVILPASFRRRSTPSRRRAPRSSASWCRAPRISCATAA